MRNRSFLHLRHATLAHPYQDMKVILTHAYMSLPMDTHNININIRNSLLSGGNETMTSQSWSYSFSLDLSFIITYIGVILSIYEIVFVFVFKRFIVPSSMHIQHHYRKNIWNKIIYKITNRARSKQFITRKGSYILSYKFQREDSKNLIVFFYLDMTIGLIKYCFQLCKLSNFLFQNVSVCLYLTFESSNRASLFLLSYC